MNQPTHGTEPLPSRINCLVLSLVGRKLLVPSTAVAEVFSSMESPAGGDGGFCYGWINWRERRIPLVSMEAWFGGEPPPLDRINRVAIFNAIHDAAGLGFFAVRLDSIPQSIPVAPYTELHSGSDDSDALLEMSLGSMRVMLPRMERVEQRIAAIPPV